MKEKVAWKDVATNWAWFRLNGWADEISIWEGENGLRILDFTIMDCVRKDRMEKK